MAVSANQNHNQTVTVTTVEGEHTDHDGIDFTPDVCRQPLHTEELHARAH